MIIRDQTSLVEGYGSSEQGPRCPCMVAWGSVVKVRFCRPMRCGLGRTGVHDWTNGARKLQLGYVSTKCRPNVPSPSRGGAKGARSKPPQKLGEGVCVGSSSSSTERLMRESPKIPTSRLIAG